MQTNVTFLSKGLNCAALLYVPDTWKEGEKLPAIVMAHGLSGVKEMTIPHHAERFAGAGFVTLLFDYRTFGDSEGEPRQQLFPLDEAEDYRNAISWISMRPEVDPQRVGIWGTSLSGGLVLYVGCFDKRARAIVAQVPCFLNAEFFYTRVPEQWEKHQEFLLKDRIETYGTGKINYIKVTDPKGESCFLPDEETYDYLTSFPTTAPNWQNRITVESIEKFYEFDPVTFVDLLPPAPILVIPAEQDKMIPLDAVMKVYEKIPGTKDIMKLPVKHYEIYSEPWLSKSIDAAIDWFKKYL